MYPRTWPRSKYVLQTISTITQIFIIILLEFKANFRERNVKETRTFICLSHDLIFLMSLFVFPFVRNKGPVESQRFKHPSPILSVSSYTQGLQVSNLLFVLHSVCSSRLATSWLFYLISWPAHMLVQ